LQGTRNAVTGESGAYEFASLPPGEYWVRFTRPSFRDAARNVVLRLSQTSRADAAMVAAGIVPEEIDVVAHAVPALETPRISTNLTLAQVERLPILRNQLDTARFAPGVNGN